MRRLFPLFILVLGFFFSRGCYSMEEKEDGGGAVAPLTAPHPPHLAFEGVATTAAHAGVLCSCCYDPNMAMQKGTGGQTYCGKCVGVLFSCLWRAVTCPCRCFWACCCPSTRMSLVVGAAAAKATIDLPDPPPPPEDRRLYEDAVRATLNIEDLIPFALGGALVHSAYPFGGEMPMVSFDKSHTPGRLSRDQKRAMPGIRGIVLTLPLKMSALERLGRGVMEDGQDKASVVPYTLYLRGTISSLKSVRDLLHAWAKKEGAWCEQIDIVVDGMAPDILVGEVLSLFQANAMSNLRGLSLRFTGLTNAELPLLRAGLERYMPHLETLVLSSNGLRVSALEPGGDLLGLLANRERVSHLTRVDLRGNDLRGDFNSGELAKALAERGDGFSLQLGYSAFTATDLGDRVDGAGDMSREAVGLLRDLFHPHHPRAEELAAAREMVGWGDQFRTLLTVGVQPLRAVDLSGAPLGAAELVSLFRLLNAGTLEKLSLAGNFGEEEEKDAAHDAVLESLGELKSLASLNISGNPTIPLPAYLTTAAALERLVHLGLADNGLGEHGFEEVMGLVRSLTRLEALDLRGNGLTDAHLKALVEAVGGMPHLKFVNLAGNLVTLESPESWSAVLALTGPRGTAPGKGDDAPGPVDSPLRCLDLRGNDIAGERVGTVVEEYPANFSSLIIDGDGERGPLEIRGNRHLLEQLSLRLYTGPFPLRVLQEIPVFSARKVVPWNDLPFLGEVLRELQVLDLGYNRGLAPFQLARLLEANTTLTDVRLDGMHLGEDGLRQIGGGLTSLPMLARLDLSSNKLKKEGVEQLQAMLADKPVVSLNLSRNNLGPEGAKVLGDVFSSVPGLKKLWLGGNGFGKGVQDISNALLALVPTDAGAGASDSGSIVPGLEVLDLSGNGITAKRMEMLVPALRAHASIRRLYLGGNDLRDGGVAILLPALPVGLEWLDISGNKLGAESARSLGRLLQERPGLHLQATSQTWGEAGAVHLEVFVRDGHVTMDPSQEKRRWCSGC